MRGRRFSYKFKKKNTHKKLLKKKKNNYKKSRKSRTYRKKSFKKKYRGGSESLPSHHTVQESRPSHHTVQELTLTNTEITILNLLPTIGRFLTHRTNIHLAAQKAREDESTTWQYTINDNDTIEALKQVLVVILKENPTEDNSVKKKSAREIMDRLGEAIPPISPPKRRLCKKGRKLGGRETETFDKCKPLDDDEAVQKAIFKEEPMARQISDGKAEEKRTLTEHTEDGTQFLVDKPPPSELIETTDDTPNEHHITIPVSEGTVHLPYASFENTGINTNPSLDYLILTITTMREGKTSWAIE